MIPDDRLQVFVVANGGNGKHLKREILAVTNYLQELVEAARRVPFPSEEREAQRRSFAFGNTNIENDRITREMVDQQADALKFACQSR